MVLLATSGDDLPPLPEGFAEYVALLSRAGSLFPSFLPTTPTPQSALQPLHPTMPTPALQSAPQPSRTAGHSFSCPNCGMGGILTEKEKVSKDIRAPATKRKSPVDLPPVVQVLPMSEVTEGPSGRQAKRLRVTKVCILF